MPLKPIKQWGFWPIYGLFQFQALGRWWQKTLNITQVDLEITDF
jgi:hypothetical protein